MCGASVHADGTGVHTPLRNVRDAERVPDERLACSVQATLADGARGPGVRALTVVARAAVAAIGVGIDARAVALHETARQLSSHTPAPLQIASRSSAFYIAEDATVRDLLDRSSSRSPVAPSVL